MFGDKAGKERIWSVRVKADDRFEPLCELCLVEVVEVSKLAADEYVEALSVYG